MERWLSYKGTCHVILLAKLHDMYIYKTVTFPHPPQKSVSEVALLHRFHYNKTCFSFDFDQMCLIMQDLRRSFIPGTHFINVKKSLLPVVSNFEIPREITAPLQKLSPSAK